jgi:hypothetical protein
MINKNLLLWAIIIIVIVLTYVGVFFLGKSSKKCDTISTVSTIIHDTTKGEIKFKIVKVPKGLTITQIDSIAKVAKKWWLDHQIKPIPNADTGKPIIGLFIAEKDTTYKDSLLIAHTKVESRIPLDPLLKFYLEYTVKKTTITKEVEREETFFSRFGYSLQTGIGYGWFSKKIDTYTGIGFHYKLN